MEFLADLQRNLVILHPDKGLLEHIEDVLLIGVHDLYHDVYWRLIQLISHSFYVIFLEVLLKGDGFMQVDYALAVLELLKLMSCMDQLHISKDLIVLID